jgi:Protein of unknown function (DUF2933)
MNDTQEKQKFWLSTKGIVILVLSVNGAVLYYLWVEHHSHPIHFLPYLLFIACPFIHIFISGGHRHGAVDASTKDSGNGEQRDDSKSTNDSAPTNEKSNQIEM